MLAEQGMLPAIYFVFSRAGCDRSVEWLRQSGLRLTTREEADRIREFGGAAPRVGTLDITLYRDDLRRRPTRALQATELPAGGLDDVLVVLVDDVLYSGRTVAGALDALREYGRPRAVQLAVLVDRGHRELPLRADYVGKNLPTSRDEEVGVLLIETDGTDAVVIRRSQR